MCVSSDSNMFFLCKIDNSNIKDKGSAARYDIVNFGFMKNVMS